MPALIETLPELIQQLPLDAQVEVRDFAEFLRQKRQPRKRRYLRQSWAGALRDYRTQYTSLELQQQALTWRDDDVSA